MSRLFGKVTPQGAKPGLLGRFGPIVGGLLSIIASPFVLLVRAFSFLPYLLSGWWGKRETKHLLFGIPTILLGLVTCFFVVNGKVSGGSQKRGMLYRSAGQAAFAVEEWDKATLFYERAIEMGISDPATKFELAKSAEQSGDNAVKSAVMESLAPADRPVFAPAHLWKAATVLSMQPLNREQVQLAVVHLRHVLALAPKDPLAHGMLGDIYFQLGRYEDAVPYLVVASYEKPVWCLMLAKACALIGDKAAAKTYGIRAQQVFRKQLSENPEDIEARLDLGEATLLLEEFPDAVRILQEGLALNDEVRYKKALTQILIQWSDSILEKDPSQRKQAFQLLASALEYAPKEMLLFDRINRLLKGQEDSATEIEAFLLDNIAQGRAVGISHLILGTALYERSDAKNAGFHLDRAFKLLPQGPIVANNFAWYLSRTEPADPERALQIISEVVSLFPDEVEYRDTKGHILVSMSRWDEAISNLEASLVRFPNRSATHIALGKAYAALGQPEIAKRHNALAVLPQP